MSGKNRRMPLPAGFQLTKDIKLLRLLSDAGASGLVYLALRDDYYWVVKELYPIYSEAKITRDERGRLLVEGDEDDREDTLDIIRSSYSNEYEKTRRLCADEKENGNSIFFFQSVPVKEDELVPLLEGTAARYLLTATIKGFTLKESFEGWAREGEELRIQIAMRIGVAILTALKTMHKNATLYLDLKEDNLFFPSELPWDNTFCVLLDCEGAYTMGSEERLSLSYSPGYASWEMNKLAQYAEVGNREMARYYVSCLNYSSDLWSVGVVLFRMILGNTFNEDGFYEIIESQSQAYLERHLNKELRKKFESSKKWLLPSLNRLFAKLFYIPTGSDPKTELEENRFKTCDEVIKELKIISEIEAKSGVHPETLARQAWDSYDVLMRQAGIRNSDKLSPDSEIFNPDWFCEAKKLDNK